MLRPPRLLPQTPEPGGGHKQAFISHSSRGWKFKITVPAVRCLVRTHFLVPSHWVSSPWCCLGGGVQVQPGTLLLFLWDPALPRGGYPASRSSASVRCYRVLALLSLSTPRGESKKALPSCCPEWMQTIRSPGQVLGRHPASSCAPTSVGIHRKSLVSHGLVAFCSLPCLFS